MADSKLDALEVQGERSAVGRGISGAFSIIIMFVMAISTVSCAGVSHLKGSGFANLKNSDDLQADWMKLKTNYGDDGKAIAQNLVRQGATCAAKRGYTCVYYFCEGIWLSTFHWFVPEHNISAAPNPSSIGYRFANSKGCGSKGDLRQMQRDFLFNNGILSVGGTELSAFG